MKHPRFGRIRPYYSNRSTGDKIAFIREKFMIGRRDLVNFVVMDILESEYDEQIYTRNYIERSIRTGVRTRGTDWLSMGIEERIDELLEFHDEEKIESIKAMAEQIIDNRFPDFMGASNDR